MRYRWNYAIGGVDPDVANDLRRKLIRHSQPSLSLLAMADGNYSNNLLALYQENPAWAAIVNDTAAEHAMAYLNSIGTTTDKLIITAHLVTEHDATIS